MDRDDVIRMAHEAGLHIATDVHWMPIIGFKYVEKLIALAKAHGAAEERNAIADAVSNCDLRATPKGLAAAIRERGQS